MASSTSQTSLTIDKLEANYPLYCRALRILIREGKSLKKVQRTFCWSKLTLLHQTLPRTYRDPQHLYYLLSREIAAAHAPSTDGV
jgi:hypothetical protein